MSITKTTYWNLRRAYPNTVGRIVEMTTQTGIHVVNYRNQLLEWTSAELKLGKDLRGGPPGHAYHEDKSKLVAIFRIPF